MRFVPGLLPDFGYDGGVVGFEILQASKVVEKAGERSRGDASDTDGQTRGRNGREHMSQMQFAVADH
jgi:hypothetical protein